MGYTQHWSLKHIKANAESEAKMQSVLNDMAIVLETIYAIKPKIFIADLLDEEWCNFNITRDKEGNVININVGDVVESFTFCGEFDEEDYIKTAHYDYDLAVVACLSILADVFGKKVVEKSDGYAEDWELGVRLASAILGRDISNPKFEPEFDSEIKDDECEHFELYSEILNTYHKLHSSHE